MTLRVGILADDLSGGMNIGVEFAQAGYRTVVVERGQMLTRADVLIMDTGTRNLPPERAYQANCAAAQVLRERAPEILVKKIDSLMRGSIGQEIDAVMDTLGYDRCLLTPASPKLDRRVIGGYVLVGENPLAEQQHLLDPLAPMTTSHVARILAQQSRRAVTHLDIDTLRQGEAAIARALQPGIIVIDCLSQQDLNRAVQVAYTEGVRCFAGTYGMGEAVCTVLRPDRSQRVLVVVGSLSDMANRQVGVLQRDLPCTHIQPDFDGSFLEQSPEAFAVPYAETLQAQVGSSAVSIVQVSAPRPVVDALRHLGETRGHDPGDLAERVERLTQAIVRPVLDRFDGFVATGGTTATGVLALFDSEGLALEGSEVTAGVAFARVQGGAFDGCPFVIKPGSQGAEDALVQLVLAVQRGIMREETEVHG